MTGRVVGIDAWRGLILALLGIILHASSFFQPALWALTIEQLSRGFRMETFFAIGGFLAYLTGNRSGWVYQRAFQLLIPLAFGWAVLLPIVNAYNGTPLWGGGIYHLWFLPAFMACSLLPRWTPTLPQVVAAAITLWLLGAVIANQTQLASGGILVAGLTSYYGILYMAGHSIAAGRIKPALVHAVTGAAALTAFTGSYAAFPELFYGEGRSIWVKVAMTAAKPATAILVTLAIFYSALRVKRVVWPMPQLSRAAYTIYLVHYPILCAAFLATADASNDAVRFSFLCAVALGASLAVHFGLVERSRSAAFLLNGRHVPRRILARYMA
jgi:hypothetical protein